MATSNNGDNNLSEEQKEEVLEQIRQKTLQVNVLETEIFILRSKLHSGIHPLELKGINSYSDDIQNTHFAWRWLPRNEEKFRVVTIEDGKQKSLPQLLSWVKPLDLCGINDYCTGLNGTLFCWRWFNRDGKQIRVVTLENTFEGNEKNGLGELLPSNFLVNLTSFEYNFRFCWRWYTREGNQFRVLTLEIPN
eukprot:TRINITY_DN3215_c0_g1_i1.p1 TRINITY_DN3215_c0_g1~~TRINITY_DN3215_c0_g1_i1.p1  ORF type:complete len:192 (+),score=82.14 TRINITY_DN3215_c0_g1_i1:154-729(+)